MTFVEWLGFLIAMIALIILSARKKKLELKYLEEHPELLEGEEEATKEQPFEVLITPGGVKIVSKEPQRLEPEEPFEEDVLEPAPKPVTDQSLPSHLVHSEPSLGHVAEPSRAQELFHDRKRLKEAILYKEILGPPKAME